MTIELKAFIKQMLTDVIGGVMEAQGEPGIGHSIVPKTQPVKFAAGSVEVSGGKITEVHFDIAVTAESLEATEGSGAFKLSVLSIGASGGAKLEKKLRNAGVNRIQFAVPVLLPYGDYAPTKLED